MKNETLIARRKHIGKTQAQVAQEVKIAESVYQRYEHGKRKPSVLTAIKIADALGVQNLRELWSNNG